MAPEGTSSPHTKNSGGEPTGFLNNILPLFDLLIRKFILTTFTGVFTVYLPMSGAGTVQWYSAGLRAG
jgi:hypothetical protein